MKPLPLFAALALALPGFAQSVPATLNYQGRLTDNSPQQAPLTTTASMSFELWDCAACTAPASRLWAEPASGTVPVTVTGGIFNVMLGSNGVPLPASVFSGGTQRWLQITVNGEALTPRQQIGATGYASQAENAASAISANSATTAVTATTAGNSQKLGGVDASGYQIATTAACGANQFVNTIAATGAAGCATPQTVIPLPLSLSGGDPGPLVHVTQTGAGQGIWSDVTTANASAVVGFNAGLGKGGNFQVTNPASGNNALYAATSGTGAAGVFEIANPDNASISLYADTNGTGYAGVLRNFNAADGNPALYVDTAGTGNALFAYSPGHNGVYGQSDSPGNSGVFGENIGGGYGVAGSTQSDTADGVLGDNFGAGPAVHGLALGTGIAGKFEIANGASAANALNATTTGTGSAGFFEGANNNISPVLWVRSDGSGDGIYVGNYGSGSGLNSGVVGAGAAVYGHTVGTGSAAQFNLLNANSTAAALMVDNQGSGPAARLLSENIQSTPLLVQAYFPGQVASLQSWTVGGAEVASLSPAGVFSGSGAGLTGINPVNLSGGTAAISITGNAATVSNGVYTTGSYADPAWIATLAGAKITGSVALAASAANATTVTNGVYTTGSYGDPAWLTSLAGGKITGAVALATSATSASSVTNGVYTTGSYSDPAWLTSVAGAKITGSVAQAANAATVTNGVYTTGSYADPAWLSSLAGAKITGSVAQATSAGNATTVTNGVYTSGSYADPVWLTSLAGAKITGSVASATSAGNAATVTNGVYTTGSYADPAWLSSLAGAKITGTVAAATNSAQLGLVDASLWQRTLSVTSCGANSFYGAVAQSGVAACASLTAPLALSGNSTGAILSGSNTGLGIGVSGVSTIASGTAYGVEGTNATNLGAGVYGFSTGANGNGVVGEDNNGVSAYGVWGKSTSGFAGNFTGKVNISGNLTVTGTVSKGGGSFKIDHPLDPANKYLYHSFVESPDMMNIYNGNITTDEKGDALITLPDWFGALNRDFRYQLTVIGEFAQAIVGKEIEGNHFTIRTSKPGVKVSWQVTGIRKDDFANAHRIPVEEDKPLAERGTFLHPVEHGQPAEKALGYEKNHAHDMRDAGASPLAAPATRE